RGGDGAFVAAADAELAGLGVFEEAVLVAGSETAVQGAGAEVFEEPAVERVGRQLSGGANGIHAARGRASRGQHTSRHADRAVAGLAVVFDEAAVDGRPPRAVLLALLRRIAEVAP